MKPPLKFRIACRLLELTQFLTFRTAWNLSAVITFLFFWFPGRLQKTIHQNIDIAFKEYSVKDKTRLARKAFRHTIAFGLEAGSVWMKPLNYGVQAIDRIEGLDIFDQAIHSGKGVLFLLPHLGNWEMANQFIAPRAKVVALYKPHPNEQLEHYIFQARCRAGVNMVPTSRQGVTQILRHLKSGGISVILPDQVPDTSGGVEVPFFNHPALTPTLAPKLAKSSQAIILGLVCARNNKGGFTVSISQAPEDIAHANVELAATAMNTYIETLVRQYPEQYQWSYKRFKKRL